jgi:threonine-phosphate decarboxylase
MSSGHGGNIYALAQRLGCAPTDIIDVSSNINPLGPMPELLDHLRAHMEAITALPDIHSEQMVQKYAAMLGVRANTVVAGAGTTQLIHALFPALKSRRVLIVGPTYSDYNDACLIHQIHPDYFFTLDKEKFTLELIRLGEIANAYDTVVICNPNNPTGTLLDKDRLWQLCARHPQTRFIIDESYLPFVTGNAGSMIDSGLNNVVVLNSLSKIFRIPGLRIGFTIAPEPIISNITEMIPPWSVNSLAQQAAQFICDHPVAVDRYVDQSQKYIDKEKEKLIDAIQKNRALRPFPSTASYFLIQLPQHLTAETVCDYFAQRKILIRNCANFVGLNDRFIRIAVHQKEVNRQIGRLLAEIRENI